MAARARDESPQPCACWRRSPTSAKDSRFRQYARRRRNPQSSHDRSRLSATAVPGCRSTAFEPCPDQLPSSGPGFLRPSKSRSRARIVRQLGGGSSSSLQRRLMSWTSTLESLNLHMIEVDYLQRPFRQSRARGTGALDDARGRRKAAMTTTRHRLAGPPATPANSGPQRAGIRRYTKFPQTLTHRNRHAARDKSRISRDLAGFSRSCFAIRKTGPSGRAIRPD